MTARKLECLRTYDEFQSVRDDWDEFTRRCFPQNYNRTHPWLSAFWASYHHDKPARIYIERAPSDGRIVAVAPLMITTEHFGGFPVLSLQTLGAGMGSDEFLVGPEAGGFVASVFEDLVTKARWHVGNFRRVHTAAFCGEIRRACGLLGCWVEESDADDFYIDFPPTYEEFLKSRTRNFRRNLKRAAVSLENEGTVTMEILDPITHLERVKEIGRCVAVNSWQFKEGKSHFNDNGSGTFYSNLAKPGRGTGGEEFTALLVDGRPVAYLLGCRRGNIFYAIDTAYDDNYRHVSVGRVLLANIIERLISEGQASFFDFEGSGEYKDYYATGVRNTHSLTVYNRSFYSMCVRTIRRSKLYSILKDKYTQSAKGVAVDA